jgi:hypothetical protein
VLVAMLVAAVPLAVPGTAAGAAGAAAPAAPAALADFNGDGIDDLAVGVPTEDLGGVVAAGVVDVIYGSESGLPDGGRQQLTQANPETGDQFGAALATGDFDGNDADNLVIGIPGEDVGTVQDAGAVISLCGSEGLMAGCADGVLTQANPEPSDLYGPA